MRSKIEGQQEKHVHRSVDIRVHCLGIASQAGPTEHTDEPAEPLAARRHDALLEHRQLRRQGAGAQ
jgi:hypothetical protein